jgi:hypothetical protein
MKHKNKGFKENPVKLIGKKIYKHQKDKENKENLTKGMALLRASICLVSGTVMAQ